MRSCYRARRRSAQKALEQAVQTVEAVGQAIGGSPFPRPATWKMKPSRAYGRRGEGGVPRATTLLGVDRAFIVPVPEFSPGLHSDFDEHRLCPSRSITILNGFNDRRSCERVPFLEVLGDSLFRRLHDAGARPLVIRECAFQGLLDDDHLRLGRDEVGVTSGCLSISRPRNFSAVTRQQFRGT